MSARRERGTGLLRRLATSWPAVAFAAFESWQLAATRLDLRGVPFVAVPSVTVSAALVWAALTVAGLAGILAIRGGAALTPVAWLAVEVAAAALFADARNSTFGALRDLHLYLDAGQRFVAGGPVYVTVPLVHLPADWTRLPFLYAPPTLPLFGLLATVPWNLAAGLWVSGSIAAAVASLRLFGLPWRWALVGLLWTPIEQGLFVGNIAIPALLLFALAFRYAWLLPAASFAKPQNAILSLWPARERRWRDLSIGIAVVIVVVAITLPLTGVARWSEWVAGLVVYSDAQRLHPSLYGVSLARWLPEWLFLVIAAGVTLLALSTGGRSGLARLGLASVVASPSLWSHGFAMALPAFLELRAPYLLLAVGLLCTGQLPGPQIALAVGVLGWLLADLRSASGADARSPLQSSHVAPGP